MIKVCVIGDPINHSLSPRLHGFWLKRYNIGGEYRALRVTQNDLRDFFSSLRELGYAGCNVTLPHKEAALQYMDSVSDIAQQAGAVNTVVVQQNGTLYGTNTDVYGFKQNMIETAGTKRFLQKKALVLGAGGAARGVCLALKELGCEVAITNRTEEKAQTIAAALGDVSIIDWDAKSEALAQVDVLVNATSLGLEGKEPLDLSIETLPLTAVVSDIVYKPLLTPLLQEAKMRGNKIVTGIGMLLHQAAPGFEAWFGIKPEVNKALESHVLEGVV